MKTTILGGSNDGRRVDVDRFSPRVLVYDEHGKGWWLPIIKQDGERLALWNQRKPK